MKERRRDARLDESLRVSVLLIPEKPEADRGLITLTAHVTSISRHGISFSTFKPIHPSSFVRVDVPSPGSTARTLSLSGIVRWAHPVPHDNRCHVGVEILDLRDPDHQAWQECVRGLYG